MEDKLMGIIDKIIELLEDDNYKAYKFFCNKLLFIDKEHKINFQAKLANNNYFFKDNINNILYIKVKKYIDNNTAIQQILKDDGKEKSYYSFIERNNYTSLARVVKLRDKDILVYTNTEVMNKSFNDILKYADSVFEIGKYKPGKAEMGEFETYFEKLVDKTPKENEDTFKNIEDAIKKHIEEKNEYLDSLKENNLDSTENEDEYEDDYEEEYEEEYEDEAEDDVHYYDTESDYDSFDVNNNNLDQPEENGYIKGISDFYDKFTLYIGNLEIQDDEKIKMIADCEAEIDDVFFDSKMLDNEVIDLKAVIEAKMKKEELEK